jgi:SAM-dependent MidA family methyltransferase
MNFSDESISGSPDLAERLRERIAREGPISFHDWMQTALYDPKDGYYCRADLERWGRAGDYRTSAERSPLFAATFARYFAELYRELNQPNRLTIVEAGAGAGHFAEIGLRTLEQHFPDVFAVTNYVVNEASLASTAITKKRLERFGARVEFAALESIELNDAGIIFSNELLDAFPVHRVICEKGELREFYVTLDGNSEFSWLTGQLSTARIAEYFEIVGVQFSKEGQIAEVNLDAGDWLRRAAAKLPRGFLITVDYGADAADLYESPERFEGTLRAFRHHQFQDVLQNPGENDITTTVDWTYLKKLGGELGLTSVLHERQDNFLLRSGLLEQLELMTALEDEAEKARLRAGAREMILPNAMAASFQVLVQKKDKR